MADDQGVITGPDRADTAESANAEDGASPEPGYALPPDRKTLEDFNLVGELEKSSKGKDFLRELSEKTLRQKRQDQKSAEGYFRRLAEALELYLGRGGTFTKGPAKGMPRPCHPTLAKIVNRIYARVMSMILQSEPVAVPTADKDNERALRLTQHISWEKRAKHPEWAPGMSASVVQWELFGSMFRYAGWDPLTGKKAIDYMGAADLILPYTDKDPSPSLENVERITRVIKMPKHKIKRLGAVGYFAGIRELFAKDADKKPTPYRDKDDEANPIREIEDSVQGIEVSEMQKRDVYQVLERHSWEELPGDELPRRIAVWVEASTKKIIRLVIMERENKLDRLRFDNEKQLAAIQAENAMAKVQQAATQGIKLPLPQSPPEPEPVRMEPIYPFVHYPFMPNPEGIYGLGVATFAGPLNELINDLLGEDLIAHRMANVQGGLMSDDVDPEKGDLELEYGKFKAVPGVGQGQLQGAFMPLPFERPKGDLSHYVEMLDEEAQSVMSSSEQQSGMAGPSHETAAAARLRSQAGGTAITAAVESFLVPLAVEYKNYARLNATFMSDAEYFYVSEQDASGNPQMVQKQVGRADYDADYEITFEADVRLEVDPGIGQSALTAYELLMANPIAKQDPNLGLAALKKALRALKASDLAARLPKFIPPPAPPSPMSQTDENAGFLQEKDHPVMEGDDHRMHLQDMSEFIEHGLHAEMSPTGKQMFQKHKQAHMAKAYLQGTQHRDQILQTGGLPPPPALGPAPGGAPAGQEPS